MRKTFCICAKNIFGIIFFAQMSLGCAYLEKQKQSRPKRFGFERSWARHTLKENHLGYRVNHVMEPLLFENMVIQGNEIDGIVAYDQVKGSKIWQLDIKGGVTSSARLHGTSIFFGAGDGNFYSVDARTGALNWTFPLRAEGLGTPLVTDKLVYFVAGNNSTYALKRQSGEQVWFYNRLDSSNLTMRGASEPSIYGRHLYLGFSDGAFVALDKKTGGVIWEKELGKTRKFRDIDAKPVVFKDRIYVSSYDGKLYCFSAKSGRVLWQHDDGGFTPVTLGKTSLFYSTSSGKLVSLEKNSGKLLWSVSLDSGVAGQPTLFRGLVIVGEWGGALSAFDQRTGKKITSFTTGRGVTSRPVVNKKTGRLFLMTIDANLFSLNLRFKGLGDVWAWEN